MGLGLEMASLFAQLTGNQEESAFKGQEARDNRAMAEKAAQDAMMRGYREAGLARMGATQMVEAQKVASAASGVDPTYGTPAQNAGATRAVAEFDALVLENNAAREAWGFKKQGAKFNAAANREARAYAARQASTVLTAGGRFAKTYKGGGG